MKYMICDICLSPLIYNFIFNFYMCIKLKQKNSKDSFSYTTSTILYLNQS